MDGGTIKTSLKLNLGCGVNRIEGFTNVDKFGELGAIDERHDLEVFPWPWADNSVDEVVLNHVLEHLGASADVFIGILKELYRVCAPGAVVRIAVPHPRHDDFLGDPTHVRVVTEQVLSLFSRKNCEKWRAAGAANSPLALYHGVDFEIVGTRMILAAPYAEQFEKGTINTSLLNQLVRERNNIVREIRMVLKVVK